MIKMSKGSYAWLVVGLLWIVAFLNYLDRILITSMRDPIVAEFKLNDAQFGLLTSVFLWSYGLLSPVGGFFADRYSRKKVILFSILVWSAVTVWTGLSSSFHELLAARLIMGVSEACYIPAALALITDYHKGRTRSLATGLHMSGLYAGLALGGIGGYVAMLWGWRYGFQLFGVFGLIYAVVLLYFLKDYRVTSEAIPENKSNQEKKDISPFQVIMALFTERSFYVLMFYFGVLGMVNWLVYGWLPAFLKTQFNLSLGEAGISATGYVQIGSFAGVLLGGLLADRWFRTNKRSRLYVVIIGFTLGCPFLFLMSTTTAFGIAVIAMMIYGLSRGINDANLMPILSQTIDSRYLATGYGCLNFLSTIIGGIMVYFGGILKDAHVNLSIIYQLSAIAMLLACWSLIAVRFKNIE